MDVVFIRELAIEAIIGVYDWERDVRQTVLLDLEMGFDISRAAASENLGDALDYHAVATRLEEFVAASRFHLLETLAERCADLVITEFRVPWLRLRVTKPGAVVAARGVGVVIERGMRE
jgi:7,8-dihydroneopterin aldolase/epimerase/oxygenase